MKNIQIKNDQELKMLRGAIESSIDIHRDYACEPQLSYEERTKTIDKVADLHAAVLMIGSKLLKDFPTTLVVTDQMHVAIQEAVQVSESYFLDIIVDERDPTTLDNLINIVRLQERLTK